MRNSLRIDNKISGVRTMGLLFPLIRHYSLIINLYLLCILIYSEGCGRVRGGACCFSGFLLFPGFWKISMSLPKIIWVFRILEHSTISLLNCFQGILACVRFSETWLEWDSNYVNIIKNKCVHQESNWKKTSQIKSETVSQIKSEMVTSVKLSMTILALISENWCINGWDLDAGTDFSRWSWSRRIFQYHRGRHIRIVD